MLKLLKARTLTNALPPIVFTHNAWLQAVLSPHHNADHEIQVDRLSKVLLAAFETYFVHPQAQQLIFEVTKAEPTDQTATMLKLSCNLLHDHKQPSVLLIDLANEHQ